jgi:hypothetical protein
VRFVFLFFALSAFLFCSMAFLPCLIIFNFQVLAALGQDYFDHILPDIIRNCSHQKASVRDGHLTLFRVIALKFSYVMI